MNKFRSFRDLSDVIRSFRWNNNTTWASNASHKWTVNDEQLKLSYYRDSWFTEREVYRIFPPAFEGISIIIRGFSEAPSPLSNLFEKCRGSSGRRDGERRRRRDDASLSLARVDRRKRQPTFLRRSRKPVAINSRERTRLAPFLPPILVSRRFFP